MENIDKGPTVPKWELINWPKIPQMPQKDQIILATGREILADF